MPGSVAISLASPTTVVAGVTPRLAARLAALDLRCVADLVRHLPTRHEHQHAEATIAEAGQAVGPRHGAEANVAVRGRIAAARVVQGRKVRVEATLTDGTATMRLAWFNAPWVKRQVHPGMAVVVEGPARRRGDWLEMVNPRMRPAETPGETLSVDADDGSGRPRRDERYRPVYPASESLSSEVIERVIASALPVALPLIEDHLPVEYRERRGFPALADAYRMIHAPASPDEALAARRRLAYDELLLLQLGVMMRRRDLRENMRADPLRSSPAIDAAILRRLPFALTPDQRAVVDEIAADCAGETPMNRLLQGDVGSGKTVVALYAMLLAVAARRQAALMAPTELLAEQHHAGIGRLLRGSQVRVALLTSDQPRRERDATLSGLADGSIDIVIGTHAVITEGVRFAALALAVIDEQHRFGVHQRATFRRRRAAVGDDADAPRSDGRPLVPHVLVMTATPIPRTLSLTVFGDLDVSTIRRPPPGRSPITTRVVHPDRRNEVYAYVADRLRRGEQAYVVVPAVEEGGLGLADVGSHLERLAQGPFAGLRVAGIHGRLPRGEREAIMDRFRAGELDALVATIVIEVGVDVPNASLMVVEHAERFGLAQLHQLRGRVGRGARRSACILVAQPTTPDAEARLAAIAETTDGFRIAERDFEIRGPGELFGARQSGAAPFVAAELPRDFALLNMARRDAEAWIARSPALGAPDEALLRRRLMKAHGEALGIGDVG